MHQQTARSGITEHGINPFPPQAVQQNLCSGFHGLSSYLIVFLYPAYGKRPRSPSPRPSFFVSVITQKKKERRSGPALLSDPITARFQSVASHHHLTTTTVTATRFIIIENIAIYSISLNYGYSKDWKSCQATGLPLKINPAHSPAS